MYRYIDEWIDVSILVPVTLLSSSCTKQRPKTEAMARTENLNVFAYMNISEFIEK